MLELNWSDVISTLQSLQSYLIAIGVVLALAIIITIACIRLPRPRRGLVRAESWIAALAAIAVIVNIICTGPMATLLTLASGSGTLTQETSDAAIAQAEAIADEGIVLLENNDALLPLAAGSNLNLFGWASTNPLYGGTGSGSLNDAYHIVTLEEGLTNAGFNLNTELSAFYTSYRADRPSIGMWSQDWTLPEPAADTYSDELLANAKAFSDTAMIVISRPGGEHIDLPADMTGLTYTENSDDYQDFPAGSHYLELSTSERNMVELVCNNFDNVIILYNGANTLELGFVDDYSQIKSVIWCPGTGNNGFNSLGRILSGEVNPSGRTVDTFVRDFTQAPYWNNFGSNVYTNMNEFRVSDSDPYVPGTIPHYVNYVEGIYVGYKYYETAAAEGFINYDTLVQYPFGHGLSYTTFTQEMGEMTESDGTITFDVTVTNTGDTTGKDVIEVYYNPPYTNGGIEKASANLIAFDKTGLLEPGTSETITVTLDLEDMASYDERGDGAYVLEQGDYIISINEDSHTIIDAQTYTVDADIRYTEGRSDDQTAATNQFAFAEGEITYLSRADGFANYDEATAAPSTTLDDASKAAFVNNSNYVIPTDDAAEMPTTGANNGTTAQDLRGASYDDARWDDLLDNLTVKEMVDLVALGGYQTIAVDSINKPATTDVDGPAALNNNFTGIGSVGFPSSIMVSATWNEALAYAFGESIGNMAEEMDVSGWYAPAMNIHRTPFAGRNFEYFSEDGVLSGRMASQAAMAAAEHGVYAYIKHFAMNDQETNRWEMITTWSTEQAIREIYLRPFEICVKDNAAVGGAAAGYPLAVMSSYNYIGTQWAGACNSLLNTVLRDEWGFEGLVLTDYFADFGYMDATRSIYNGGSACLINRDVTANYVTDTDNPLTVQQLRKASKDILYTTLNSRANDPANITTGLLAWQIILIAVDVVLAALIILLEVLTIRGYKRKAAAAATVIATPTARTDK